MKQLEFATQGWKALTQWTLTFLEENRYLTTQSSEPENGKYPLHPRSGHMYRLYTEWRDQNNETVHNANGG